MKSDEIRVGCYQIITVLLLSINLITVSMSHVLSLLYKYTPKFYCQDSLEDVKNVMNRTYGCLLAGCPNGYTFDYSLKKQHHDESGGFVRYESSVVTEWQLICERAHLLTALKDFYLIGLFLGGLITGFLADRIGRLPVLAFCLYAQGAMAVALNIVEKYQLFLVFRGLQGFFMQGLESCTFILCMELFPTKYRNLVALIILSIRSLGMLLMTSFSFFISDWRILQLISCVPTAITVFYIWLIPESYRWLLAKGKTIEAELLLERITKYNSLLSFGKQCKEIPRDKLKRTKTSDDARCADLERSLHESLNLLSEQQKNDTDQKIKSMSDLDTNNVSKASTMILDLDEDKKNDKINKNVASIYDSIEFLKNKNQSDSGLIGFFKRRFIGRTCLLLMFAWFTSSIAFHSLIGIPQKLSLDIRVTVSLAAAMEICTFVFSYALTTSKHGKRWSLSVGQILAGVVCIVFSLITLDSDKLFVFGLLANHKFGVIVIGRIVNIMSFFILRLVMIELLPTTSRATGVGLCMGAEMMGGLLMTFIQILDKFVPELGRIVIGFTCICSGLLVHSLPETLHKDVQSIEDNNRYKETSSHGIEEKDFNRESRNSESLEINDYQKSA